MRESPSSIPAQWLGKRIDVSGLTDEFNEYPPSPEWLNEWQTLLNAMQPGDELWTYRSPSKSWQYLAGRAGYAVVREGTIVDAILTVMN